MLALALQPAVVAAQAGGSARADARPAVLQALRVGQVITLKPGGMLWEIEILNDGSLGTHQVVEVAAQHLVVQDVAGITRTWIPVAAIKSVAWTRIETPNTPPLPKLPPPVGPWPVPGAMR